MVKAELGPDAMILSTKKDKIGGILGFFSKPVYRVTAAIDPVRKAVPSSPAVVPAVYREPPERQRTAREDLENSMLAPLARELRELRDKVESLSRREEQRKEELKEETPPQPGSQSSGININNIPRGDLEEIKKLLLNSLTKSQECAVKTVQWPTAHDTSLAEEPPVEVLLPDESSLAKELDRSGISTEMVRTILDTLATLPADGGNQSSRSRLGET